MRLRALMGCLFLIGLWSYGAGAQTLYVNADNAPLRQERSVAAGVVATLRRGDTLNLLNQDARWYYVATSSGQQGWIYRYKVTASPPQRGVGNIFAGLGGTSSGVSIGESSSATGIRGLNPIAERQARRQGRDRAVAAVKVMERPIINAKALQNFLRGSKLGEYQEGP